MGLAAPFALLAVGHFVPPMPETGILDPPPVLTLAQQRFEKASAFLFPRQFVIGILALAVTERRRGLGNAADRNHHSHSGLTGQRRPLRIDGPRASCVAKIIRETSRGRYPASGSGK